MTPPFFMLLLLSFTVLMRSTSSQDCSNVTVQQCKTAFIPTIQSFNLTSVVLSDVIPSWSGPVLMSLCQSYDLYAGCMKTVTEYCSTNFQLTTEGVTDAWDYLCNSSSEYLNYSSCFQKSDLRQNVDFCNATLQKKLDSLKLVSGAQEMVDQYCSYHDNYVTCLSTTISASCGKAAAKWQQTFVEKLLTPILSYLSCPGWDDSQSDDSGWSDASVVIAVFIGVTLFLMILVVVVLAVMVVRRRKLQRERPFPPDDISGGNGTNGSTQPPSYCEPYVVYEPAITGSSTSVGDDSVGDSSDGGRLQYRMRFIDPLTGLRRDGGLIDAADLPYKISETVPPPYADQPPPSFDEALNNDGGRQSLPQHVGTNGPVVNAETRPPTDVSATTAATAADNMGFVGDEGNGSDDNRVILTEDLTSTTIVVVANVGDHPPVTVDSSAA